MEERDKKYKKAIITRCSDDWDEYKKERNNITSIINKSKENYFLNKIDGNKNNTREMWKSLKCLLPDNIKHTNEAIIFKNVEISEAQKIAEYFNNYFIGSISDIIKTINPEQSINNVVSKVPFYRHFSHFKQLEMIEFKTIIKELSKKGGRMEGITYEVLNDSSKVIANQMLDVINSSLNEGIFPEEWKISKITPVPKVSNAKTCDEFRPINTVPVYEKLLETVVKHQLLTYCSENNILVQHQSGFRRNHSCESIIQCAINKWYSVMDRGELVLAIFLDFRRAFETVNREILIKKLERMGMCGVVIKWFQSYLTGRKQIVNFKKLHV